MLLLVLYVQVMSLYLYCNVVFFQAEDGIRDLVRSRGLGDVYKRQMQASAEEVLGLDVDSVSFLQRAMTESLRRRTPVASHPFRLVEGNLAYVVFSPNPQPPGRDGSPPASVSYTTLTPPPNDLVQISVAAVPFKQKKQTSRDETKR